MSSNKSMVNDAKEVMELVKAACDSTLNIYSDTLSNYEKELLMDRRVWLFLDDSNNIDAINNVNKIMGYSRK